MDKNTKIGAVVTVLVLILIGIGVASSHSGTSQPEDTRLNVVTTVAPITNIVHNIGGDAINLHGIIPEGTDSHTFEPAPGDAVYLSKADLLIVNGLHLETPTEKLADANRKPGSDKLVLGDNTITENDWIYDFSFPKEKGDPNPHLWMNPQYAAHYAELIRDELVKDDPAHADYYKKNADVYLKKIDALDQGIQTAINTIPPENRKLLTYHDSWAYFSRRYGMTVIGAIQPSDFTEPTPSDVASIIDQLKATHLPAIFGSEVFPSTVMDQIGREANVKWVTTLRDDDLPGDPSAPEHTYVGLMLEDMKNMVIPLGGNIDSLKNIDPANTNAPL